MRPVGVFAKSKGSILRPPKGKHLNVESVTNIQTAQQQGFGFSHMEKWADKKVSQFTLMNSVKLINGFQLKKETLPLKKLNAEC